MWAGTRAVGGEEKEKRDERRGGEERREWERRRGGGEWERKRNTHNS